MSTTAGIPDVLGGKSPLDLLLMFLPRATDLRYVYMACYTWLIYDWCLTFPDELRLIWGQGWRLGEWSAMAYLVIRWLGFGLQTFEIVTLLNHQSNAKYCERSVNLIVIGGLLCIFIVEITLQARVYAMYRCDRRILVANLTLFCTNLVVTYALFATILPQIKVYLVPSPIQGCWSEIPRDLYRCFLPALIFEIWLWLLVARKAYLHAKQYATDERKAIVTLLFRDSIVWSIVIICVLVSNAVIFTYAERVYNFVGIPIFQTIVCIGGSRLVLSIRQAYYTESAHKARAASGVFTGAYDVAVVRVLDNGRRFNRTPETSGDFGTDCSEDEDEGRELPDYESSEYHLEDPNDLESRGGPLPSGELHAVIDVAVEVEVAR